MSWKKRQSRMAANKAAIVEQAVAVCAVLREQARGGLGYYETADVLADCIEDELIPRDRWDDSTREAAPAAAPAPAQAKGWQRCRRCGFVYALTATMCDDPSAPGSGNAGVCGGTLEPVPPSAPDAETP